MNITYGIKLRIWLSNSLADHPGSILENEKLEMEPNLSFLHTERCESETAFNCNIFRKIKGYHLGVRMTSRFYPWSFSFRLKFTGVNDFEKKSRSE